MTTRRLAISLTVVGVAIAVYLSVVHYSQESVPLLCSSSGLVNCAQVTTSPQSMIGPLPVAALGVLWFVVMLVLLVMGGRSGPLAVVRLLWAAIGLLVVFYLIYAELFLVGAICLWCSAVHVLVIALFLTQLAELTSREYLEGKGG